MRWVEGRSLRALVVGPRSFWSGTAIIVPLTLLAHLLYDGIGYLRGEATAEFLAQYPTGWVLVGSVCFAFVRSYILQALPEELIYRGWLADVTRDRPRLTLAWTTAAFTVVHLVSSGGQEDLGDRMIYLALPLGMGLLAGALRLTTGSVWAGVATHGGMHMVNSLVPPLVAVRGFDAAWVLLLGGVQALAAAVILRRRGFSQRKPHIVGC
ncbi:CPBP family intramembrane glutamic endopeptidase [Corynebacterium mastitidis]|uniref:CPBP family intramembrane glutamic endopeptidase n=1 Tax=Corynebacterium mastitidis TaxID=161890 RepID=A0ABU8NYW3_9CORY